MNIFVAKLNPVTTSKDLQKLFAHYGIVTNVKVIIDHFTGRSKGYGFVEMPDFHEAEEALRELDNTPFQEYLITVKNSQPGSYPVSTDKSEIDRNPTFSERIRYRQEFSGKSTSTKSQREIHGRRNFGYR